jgi:hypothetical protein
LHPLQSPDCLANAPAATLKVNRAVTWRVTLVNALVERRDPDSGN